MSYETERFASINYDTLRAQAMVKMLKDYTKEGTALNPDEVFSLCVTLERYLGSINTAATVDAKPA